MKEIGKKILPVAQKETDNNVTGERLKLLRTAKKLSQKTMAEKLGITQQSYFNWENGTSTPRADNLQKAAEILEVSTSFLLGNDADENDDIGKLIEKLIQATESGKLTWIDLEPEFTLIDMRDMEFAKEVIRAIRDQFSTASGSQAPIQWKYVAQQGVVFVLAHRTFETLLAWGTYSGGIDYYTDPCFSISDAVSDVQHGRTRLLDLRDEVFKSEEAHKKEFLEEALSVLDSL